MQVPKILFVALVSHAFLKSASAALEVYTDLAAWNARVALAAGAPCTSLEDFSGPDIPLVVGTTDLGLFDTTVNALPANGTPLGQLEGRFKGWLVTTGPTVLNFHNFDNSPVIAVAGYWLSSTTGNKLTVTINGIVTKFSTYFTP